MMMTALPADRAAVSAPKADLWPRWERNDPDSRSRVDHGLWDHFLNTYVREDATAISRIPYGTVTENDRRALRNYTVALSSQTVGQRARSEKFAFWVNLYNSITVQLVLMHYPVRSIRDIDLSPGIFSRGPWDKKLVRLEGEELSLNDIEHRIVRPLWRDPRIHYAVNCASPGCPNLQRNAFTAGIYQPSTRSIASRRQPGRLQHLRSVRGGFRRQ